MSNLQNTTSTTEVKVKPIAVVYQANDGARITISPIGVMTCDCQRFKVNARLFDGECDHTRAVQAYRRQPLAVWTH